MLANQGGLQSFFNQSLARPGDRIDTGLHRRRNLGVAPALTTLRNIRFQQDTGLQQLLCRMLPALDNRGEPVFSPPNASTAASPISTC